MKSSVVDVFESVAVHCLECGGCLFEARYEENFCEAGSCLRLFCKACGEEMGFGLSVEADTVRGQRFIKTLKEAKAEVVR